MPPGPLNLRVRETNRRCHGSLARHRPGEQTLCRSSPAPGPRSAAFLIRVRNPEAAGVGRMYLVDERDTCRRVKCQTRTWCQPESDPRRRAISCPRLKMAMAASCTPSTSVVDQDLDVTCSLHVMRSSWPPSLALVVGVMIGSGRGSFFCTHRESRTVDLYACPTHTGTRAQSW